jgi:hypothetical protein
VYKDAHLLQVTIEGVADPILIAYKKGVIPDAEFQLMGALSAKGLMQRPFLKSLLKNVDGPEAISIEEWVPGRSVFSLHGDPGVAAAVGELDALVYLRTASNGKGYFNRDLHYENIKAYVESGRMKARAIDFDPERMVLATADQYFAASLLRRKSLPPFDVPSTPDYIRGVVDAFAREPGHSANEAITILRRTRDNLADPAKRADALSVENFSRLTNQDAAITALISDLDAFLTAR